MKRWFTLYVCALVAFLLVACKSKDGTVRGSCEKNESDGFRIGSVRQCADAYTESRAEYCKDKKSSKPCPRADAVAGCKAKDGAEITWFFNGPGPGGSATLESVGKYCVDIANGTTLLPSGEVAKVKNADELRAAAIKTSIDQNGVKAKAALATVATIAAKLPAATGKLDLQGLKGDTLIVHREDLSDLENPKKLDYRLKQGDTLGACARILNNRPRKSDEPYTLDYCAKNPLLAIVSVSSYAPAVATGSSVSGNTKTTFVKPARISSDVLFFRTDSGKYLGSFPVFVENTTVDGPPDRLTRELLEKWPTALYMKAKSATPTLTLLFDLAK